jgi:GNAT superfamily N-acetyltransferase
MKLEVIEAVSKRDLKDFVRFPYRLYKNHPFWVPPLIREQKKWIIQKKTPLFRSNPHLFLLARQNKKTAGRMAVSEDLVLKEKRNKNLAYFTLFECIEDLEAFKALFAYAEVWARARGLDGIQGSVSPTKGDDFRGWLAEGYDSKPVLMNSYNPAYYLEYIEKLCYKKYKDFYAYHYDKESLDLERRVESAEYAKRKYGFRIDRIDLKNLENEAKDIKEILDKSMSEWGDMTPPSYEDVLNMALRFKRFADPDIILIARDEESRPIGFNISLPDYNFVLSKLKGKLGITGGLKFLYFRRKIKGARSFIMFVVPEFRGKGVAQSIYITAFKNGFKKGMIYAEGSTIGEENKIMRASAEKIGGRHYKTYRIYEKHFKTAI